MGLFSDTCTALIDSATGKALTGEALQRAKQDPKASRCGHRVSKKARFCSRCGAQPPGGWWKCPGCGNWVGNESNFCWNCKQPLSPESRLDIAGGVWQKPADAFAQRFEVGDIKQLLQKGIHIQTGTAAILLDSGAAKDVLGPGRHNLDSLAHKINWWGNPPPRSIILVDNGDVVLPVRLEGLRSSEEIPLVLYAELTLHFVEKRAENFVANLFKSRDRLTYEQIGEALAGEIRLTVDNLCNTSTAEDLVKDPQRRIQLEDGLQRTLKGVQDRYGLEIAHVGSVDFTGKEYEELRARSGDLEIKRRQAEFEQRMRELGSADQMAQFKTQQDLAEYVAQLAQEKAVGAEQRKHELVRLQQSFAQELDRREREYGREQAKAEAAAEIDIDGLRKGHARDNQVKDAEAQAAARAATFKQEAEETEKALEWDRRKHQAQIDRMEALAKILEGKSLPTVLALVDDPAKRKDMLAFQQQKLTEGRTAEEILALAAAQSPAVADALARMAGVKREDLEKLVAERKALFDSEAARGERMYNTGLTNMAQAAKKPDQGPTTQVIK